MQSVDSRHATELRNNYSSLYSCILIKLCRPIQERTSNHCVESAVYSDLGANPFKRVLLHAEGCNQHGHMRQFELSNMLHDLCNCIVG